jgi:uncharacterized phage protein (TIGR01671 family)
MRKIKFRGQRIEDKRFIYGGLSIYNKNYEKDQNEHLFLVETAKDNIGFITMMQEIIPETLGQFTGLLDKNGKEIYEGDIVAFENKWEWYRGSTPEWYRMTTAEQNTWVEKQPTYHIAIVYDPIEGYSSELSRNYSVVGNIHQNPELLGEKK